MSEKDLGIAQRREIISGVYLASGLEVISKVSGEVVSVGNLLQFEDETLITNPRFSKKIYDGYGFSVSKRFEDVANDSSEEVYFENPDNSGRDIYLIAVEVVSFGQVFVDVYRGNSVTSGGTSLTPINLNFDSIVSSVVSVEYGGAYSLGNNVHETVCPGGTKVKAVGGATEVGELVVIPENFNFLVRVTNKSGGNTSFSIRIIWFEES